MKRTKQLNSTADLRKQNILNILLAIRTNAALTKPEIGKHISATRVTAHNLINELTEHGLLLENGSAKSNGGRKASLYKLNPDCGFIIAQNISTDGIKTRAYGLGFRLLAQRYLETDTTYSNKVEKKILGEIHRLINDKRWPSKYCLGIGISVPGRIDPLSHTIKTLVHVPGWHGVNLQQVVEKETGIPVLLENDNSAAVLAMKWTGVLGGDANAAYVTISVGMGVGVLINGTLSHGSHGSAGELGHTAVLLKGGSICSCGKRGCLETVIGYDSILDTVNKRLKNQKICSMKQVIDLAKKGNTKILDIIDNLTTYFSIALDHIAKAYDPDVIIVENIILRELKDVYHKTIKKTFARNAFVEPEKLKIILNPQPDIDIIGAAAIVEDYLFHNIEKNRLLKKVGY